jgi:putative ABC transport system permease protein
MSPLTRKLGRDLWRIKGQAVAIALVISVAVMMQVMMTGLVASLEETRRTYYERYRLADIFAPVTRAPERMLPELLDIPGVRKAEARVIGSALIDLEGIGLPIQAQVVSLPGIGDPVLNDIFLTSGRRIGNERADEVLILKSFAEAHGLVPGDRLTATMNGSRRSFKIVGFAQSPEFLYTAAPGEFISDDSRFAVLWMSRKALQAAFDMNGAFNEAILSLEHGTDPQGVLAAVDRLLDRYGGLGSFATADLTSNRFISEDIAGLRSTSVSIPPIFLGVAAFLLYIVVSRMVQAEREEIGLMKAFGYTDIEVGSHYFQLILSIAIGGAIAGCLMGIAAGRVMADVYLEYFKFPFLVFRLEPSSFVSGILASVLSAAAGGLFVLRRVFSLTPATAMRPSAPPDYSRSGRFAAGLNRFLDLPTRMVLRRITRQPWRMAGAVAGISAGVALSAAMASLLASFDDTIELTFNVVDRSDLTVTFIHPLAARTIFDLESIPGVIEVEPVRIVPVIFNHGLQTYRGAMNGLGTTARLYRAVDDRQLPIWLPDDGVILGAGLAKALGAKTGDLLTLDVREGRQPVVELSVVGVAQTLLGSPAYMEMTALNRVLGEPLRASGAFLRVDDNLKLSIYQTLKNMPMVAGVGLKSDERAALQKMMDQGAGAMRYFTAVIAAVISFGIVYNAARVAQAERSRDLASLRVLGFTRGEVAFVLLGELAVVTLLALPFGGVAGYYLTSRISEGFSTDLYQIQAYFSADSYSAAILIVVAAALVSGWLVKRDIEKTDLVIALKTRE